MNVYLVKYWTLLCQVGTGEEKSVWLGTIHSIMLVESFVGLPILSMNFAFLSPKQ